MEIKELLQATKGWKPMSNYAYREKQLSYLYRMFNGEVDHGLGLVDPVVFQDSDLQEVYKKWLDDRTSNMTDPKVVNHELLAELLADDNEEYLYLDNKTCKKMLIDEYNKDSTVKHCKNVMMNINGDYELLVRDYELMSYGNVKEADAENDIELLTIEMIKDHQERKPKGLMTGKDPLDRVLLGMEDTSYILIGARPSIGKSVLGMEIGKFLAGQGRKTQIFSLEMTKNMYYKRLLFNQSRVQKTRFDARVCSKIELERLLSGKEKLVKTAKNVSLIDSQCTIYDIQEKAREYQPEIIIVDYLQYIKSHDKSLGRRECVEYISQNLKELAKELNCVVICICSLNRAEKGKENKPPVISDLKETSNLEYDADTIILMHRDVDGGVYVQDLDIIIPKNRNGNTGMAKARMSQYFSIESR